MLDSTTNILLRNFLVIRRDENGKACLHRPPHNKMPSHSRVQVSEMSGKKINQRKSPATKRTNQTIRAGQHTEYGKLQTEKNSE